jgi:hypothetical protein
MLALAFSGLVTGVLSAVAQAQGTRPPPPPNEEDVKIGPRKATTPPPRQRPAQDEPPEEQPAPQHQVAGQQGKAKPVDESNLLLREPHVCRGLNTCRGKGADGRNACAGQGVCATAPHHVCKGNNQCRGLGACEEGLWPQHQPEYPGENTCRGKGGCQVPMYPTRARMWHKARNRFIALMLDAGKRVGNPPR